MNILHSTYAHSEICDRFVLQKSLSSHTGMPVNLPHLIIAIIKYERRLFVYIWSSQIPAYRIRDIEFANDMEVVHDGSKYLHMK